MKPMNRTMACSIAAFAFLPAFAAELDVGAGASDNTYSDTSSYAAATTIIKTGTGKTTLDLGDMTTSFKGKIEVREGTLAVASTPNSFGAPTNITVVAGATLDLTWSGNAAGKIADAELVIAGDGVGNGGAIRRTGSQGINALLGKVTLSGNARIYADQQVGFASAGCVNLNGFTLIKDGSNKLYCQNTGFYGADGTTADPGNIVVVSGTLFLRDGNALQGGSADNTITLQEGTTLQLRNASSINWAINASGSSTISTDGNVSDANRNRLCGPISGEAEVVMNASEPTTHLSLYGNSLTLEDGLKVNGYGPLTFTDVAVTNRSSVGIDIQNSGALARMVLKGGTLMASETNESVQSFGRVRIGGASGRKGALEICDKSVVTNFSLSLGREGLGALYQRGGSSFWTVTDASYDRSANTLGSYGYFGLTGGRFMLDAGGLGDSDKYTYFGVIGRFVMALHGGSADFVSSDKIGFAFKGGTFVYYQDGGATNSFDGEFGFGNTSDRNRAGHAFVTVSGTNTRLQVGSYLRSFLANADAETFININNGGTLATKYIYRLSTLLPFYLNFNGGILRPLLSNNSFTYRNEAERYPTAATVYEGGLTIDTTESLNGNGEQAASDNFRIMFPLVAPAAEGKRIASIALPSAVSSMTLVGSPVVTISGDGAGASAFALFDDTTRTVTNIVVTSPGWGYTEATAKLVDGGLAEEYECEVTLADQPAAGWAGLTKRGATKVDMFGANTFAGDITVEEGQLSFLNSTAAQNGMPEGAGVTVKNGATISFAASDTAVTVPFLAGCGSTSYGYFTVTNRIECTAADIFAGRHLRIGRNITLADGVKIVVTDPENLAAYRNRGRAVVLEGGVDAANYTLTCAGRIELDLGGPSGSENADSWRLSVRDKRIMLGCLKGLVISLH